MREHRQHLKTSRTVGGDDFMNPDFSAWLDDDAEDDFAAGIAAMREVERDWWASAFDA